MRVLCLNGWGGRLHDALVAYVRAADPDVLCLQEVVHTPDAPRPVLSYRDGGADLPQRANFFADVAAALPDHAAMFCPAARGDLWDGDRAVPSQWGLATFVRRTLPVIGQAQGFVHGKYGADGYGAHPRSRSAHAVRVWDHAGGFGITIGHMHGLRDPAAGKHDTPARAAQAERLAALVAGAAEPGARLVVCGDFNVLPESGTFGVLARLGLADLVTGRGFADTRTSYYAKPERFADYMLVNAAVTITGFDVVAAPEVSDHRALLLDLC